MKARSSFVGALRLVVLAAVTLPFGACGGGSQSGPSVGSVSPAAVAPHLPQLVPTQQPSNLDPVQRFAWQQVVNLGEAFAAGDVDGFLSRVSRGFYRSYSKLESSLKELLANSSARKAVVAVRLVTEEEGRVSVRAEWTRSVTRPDGSVDARHGETVFLFLKSDTSLRLLDYRGDAPFGLEGI